MPEAKVLRYLLINWLHTANYLPRYLISIQSILTSSWKCLRGITKLLLEETPSYIPAIQELRRRIREKLGGNQLEGGLTRFTATPLPPYFLFKTIPLEISHNLLHSPGDKIIPEMLHPTLSEWAHVLNTLTVGKFR